MKQELEFIFESINGDLKSQRKLFDMYKSQWYLICLRYMSNKSDADDALQNGLVKIYSNLSKYKNELGEFSAWSNKILVNECLMLLRRNKLLMQKSFQINDSMPYYDDVNVENYLNSEELISMIQKLPDGYRSVFNLYVLEGYSHQEISEKLSISQGTSKSQLFKAKKMLQKVIEFTF